MSCAVNGYFEQKYGKRLKSVVFQKGKCLT